MQRYELQAEPITKLGAAVRTVPYMSPEQAVRDLVGFIQMFS